MQVFSEVSCFALRICHGTRSFVAYLDGKLNNSLHWYWHSLLDTILGVTPRAIQAIWQTVFMVVVPNMMGI